MSPTTDQGRWHCGRRGCPGGHTLPDADTCVAAADPAPPAATDPYAALNTVPTAVLLAAIGQTLHGRPAYATGGNLALRLLCDRLEVDCAALEFDPHWISTHIEGNTRG